MGKKNRPYWRIVAVDSRCKRDGAYLECFGTYDPIKHKMITINKEKIDDWVKKGAKCSDCVLKIIRRAGV
jgi:small subunit ribosomal protein S16